MPADQSSISLQAAPSGSIDSINGSIFSMRTALKEDVISTGIISMELAASYLAEFRNTFGPHFPFVIIPPHVEMEELREVKPFLFLAILTISSYKDPLLQRRFCDVLKQNVANRMVLRPEASFEMLQGLLVYLAW